MYAGSFTYTTILSLSLCEVTVDVYTQGKWYFKCVLNSVDVQLKNLRIVSGMKSVFFLIKMMCWHSFSQSLMGSHERPTDASIFPEGIHHISYACSLCFHISGDGKEKSQRLCVHIFFLNDVNNLQPHRNIFWPLSINSLSHCSVEEALRYTCVAV